MTQITSVSIYRYIYYSFLNNPHNIHTLHYTYIYIYCTMYILINIMLERQLQLVVLGFNE